MPDNHMSQIFLWKDQAILCHLGGIGKVRGKEPSVMQAMKQKLEKMEGVKES